MANTLIPYATKVWNVMVGCSYNCPYCYARPLHNMRHKAYLEGKLQNIPQYAKPFHEVQFLEKRLSQPSSWRHREIVFVNSMGDLFDKNVPFEWIRSVFANINVYTQHSFMVLTKQPDRMIEYLKWYKDVLEKENNLWVKFPHVLMGVTITNQEDADKRIPLLQQVKLLFPEMKIFLSIEPMLGSIDLSEYFGLYQDDDDQWRLKVGSRWSDSPDLVICGGQTGPNSRPLHPANVRVLRDQ
ncbi:MAG: DUF5131 family protein, partial [Bacillota bacterium]